MTLFTIQQVLLCVITLAVSCGANDHTQLKDMYQNTTKFFYCNALSLKEHVFTLDASVSNI